MLNSSINFIGNNNVYEILKKNYIERSLSHSIIVYGEKGIGKSTFVKFFALQIFNNFENHYQKLSKSNHIELINSNAHPNFMLIDKEIDEKSKKRRNFIVIDQIRKIESFIYQTSMNIHHPKIILIDNADQLNSNSANALLKILEEPKRNTYFFLISDQLSSLLPTIRSRCIKFKLKKPSFEHFSQIIKNTKENITEPDINFLYDLSSGSPGLALEFYSEDISSTLKKIVEIIKKKESLSVEMINFATNLRYQSNDQYKFFLIIIKFILSNLIKIYFKVNIHNQFMSDISNTLEDLIKYINLKKCMETMDFIEENQKNLFIFNLDKKIFTLNLFSELSDN